MRITDILIEDRIKEKILAKHNINASEIKHVILDKPYMARTKDNRYMAIGYYSRYVTIIFEMVKKIAFIVTAYPSSDAQTRLYKLKRR